MSGWPRELRHPLFLGGAVLYGISSMYKHGGSIFTHWQLPPVLSFYLADVLALPLELTLALWLMRRFYFRWPAFILPGSWIISSWLVTSIWFEVLLPRYDSRATADLLDVVAYAVGGLLFWRWMNKPDTQ